MGCTYSIGPPRDVNAMKRDQLGARLVQIVPKTSINSVQLNRTDNSLYLYGNGENHILDLLLRNSSVRFTAGLTINLLTVRNDSLIIVQVMESNYKIQSAGELGVFHYMNRREITCASLYFALQRDVFPKLRVISPPPSGNRIALKYGYNKNLIRN